MKLFLSGLCCLVALNMFSGNGSPVTGKYQSTDFPAVTLKLKKNGTFRYTYHLIHTTSYRGNWTMSGDTVKLDFFQDHPSYRFVRSGEHDLKSVDSASCSFGRIKGK